MIVLKFGGTSIGTAERMKSVAGLISDQNPKIIVLSAISGATNILDEISGRLENKTQTEDLLNDLSTRFKSISKELFESEENINHSLAEIEEGINKIKVLLNNNGGNNIKNNILAQGEIVTTKIFHRYLEEIGLNTVLLPALNFMRIDKYGEPDTFYIQENLLRELKAYHNVNIFITQGYICKNASGKVDNLSRGGSDTTASLIGSAVKAKEIQIWSDIDGLHNNDPRYVSKTHSISRLSYSEAEELAYFGAKILHPMSIFPAKEEGIPVLLKDTTNPSSSGTVISSKTENTGIKAVASKDGISIIKIKSGRMLLAYGFLKKVFEIFDIHKTPVDTITTSEVSVSVTIDNTENLNEIIKDLEKYGAVEVVPNQSLVCVVGDLLAESKGKASKILQSLEEIPVGMISYGASNNNISLVINSEDKKKALNLLNEHIFN